jgi:hypothetical protein
MGLRILLFQIHKLRKLLFEQQCLDSVEYDWKLITNDVGKDLEGGRYGLFQGNVQHLLEGQNKITRKLSHDRL